MKRIKLTLRETLLKHSKIITGFSFLDQKWSGIYSGGNYFIFGAKKTGKTILALNLIEHLIQANYNVLFLSSERKKSLEIQASSVYFDIEESISKGILNVQRIDEKLSDIEEIKSLITEKNPSVLVIDEVIDSNLSSIRDNYLEFIEFLEELNITSVFLASIPSGEDSRKYIKEIVKNSTGIIQLQKSSQKRNYSGVVTLKPNTGHFEGEFETSYKVEPIKGFITLSDNVNSILGMLSNIEKSPITNLTKSFEYSNVYNIEEFNFLLESRIAFSESTGEKTNIITYELLDEKVEPIEIGNSLSEKLAAGDKICFTDKIIYILPANSENEAIEKLSNDLDDVTKSLFNNNGEISESLRKSIRILKPNFKIS